MIWGTDIETIWLSKNSYPYKRSKGGKRISCHLKWTCLSQVFVKFSGNEALQEPLLKDEHKVQLNWELWKERIQRE